MRSGKIALPVDDSHFQLTWAFWKSTQAFRKGLLDTSNMPALPMTTSVTHAMSTSGPAEKVAQIGLDASHKVLRGLAPARTSSMPVLVVDLWAHVGETGKAVLQEKFSPSLAGPVYYLGCHDDEVEARSAL